MPEKGGHMVSLLVPLLIITANPYPMNTPHHPHDRFAKSAFSHVDVARDLLQAHLPATTHQKLDLSDMVLVSEGMRLPAQPERRGDLVYRVRIRGRKAYAYVMLEFQTTQDHYMMLRLLTYNISLWNSLSKEKGRKKIPPIINIVLYTGTARYKTPTNFSGLMDNTELAEIFSKDHLLIPLQRLEDAELVTLC